MTGNADETTATTKDFQSRIDRARAEGLRLEVSIIEADREESWVVDADAVTVDDGTMTLRFGQEKLEFAYSGPSALPVMPSLVAMDRAHALRAKAISIRKAIGRIGGGPAVMRFSDGRDEAVVASDLMHVASTGIYPPTVPGIDWNEVSSVESDGRSMTVLSARDGSVAFTMTAAA